MKLVKLVTPCDSYLDIYLPTLLICMFEETRHFGPPRGCMDSVSSRILHLNRKTGDGGRWR